MLKKYAFLSVLLLLAFNSFGQNLSSANIIQTVGACYGECPGFQVYYPVVKETTSYTVSSIPFNPIFGTTNGSSSQLYMDDRWSGVIDLKGITPQDFNFCFYGQNYKKVMVSTNGAITFSIAGEATDGVYAPDSYSSWTANNPIPFSGPGFDAPYKNSIHGVFQDYNPAVSNVFAQPNINYYTIGGYPNRAFVVSFAQLAQFNCSDNSTVGAQTSQIVLYESSNVIDVYVYRRFPCNTWSNGAGLIGIQNQTGTQGVTPTGRNLGDWSATNEAWRFLPDGNVVEPTITWFNQNNDVIGTGSTVTTCPTTQEMYTAEVSYQNCASSFVISATEAYTPTPQILPGQANDLSQCSSAAQPYYFDLTQNENAILNGMDPFNYIVTYHTTSDGAQFLSNEIISNPEAFASSGQTIYVRVEDLNTGCLQVTDFDLVIQSVPSAPTGEGIQAFTQGQTLADLVVNGSNIQWYTDSQGGTLLPESTLLVDGVTYYASQTNFSGCESKNINSARLAVTVQNVLSSDNWDNVSFKAYPNPVTNVLNLSYSSEISSVEVFNMLGQKVIAKTFNVANGQVDMSNLNTGTYIVKVTADGLTKAIKVVKQ